MKDLHCSREQIDLYFDEIAKEYFLSLGLARPLLRLFRGEVTYRSRFLDDLYAARPPLDFHLSVDIRKGSHVKEGSKTWGESPAFPRIVSRLHRERSALPGRPCERHSGAFK